MAQVNHSELVASLSAFSAQSKKLRVMITVVNQNTAKRDKDMLDQVFGRMIDVETVRAARRKPPLRERAQVRQTSDQNHRGLADAEEQPLGGGVRHAPARPARKLDRALCDFFQVDELQDRTLIRVADAGGYADAFALDDRSAVWSWP